MMRCSCAAFWHPFDARSVSSDRRPCSRLLGRYSRCLLFAQTRSSGEWPLGDGFSVAIACRSFSTLPRCHCVLWDAPVFLRFFFLSGKAGMSMRETSGCRSFLCSLVFVRFRSARGGRTRGMGTLGVRSSVINGEVPNSKGKVPSFSSVNLRACLCYFTGSLALSSVLGLFPEEKCGRGCNPSFRS